MPIINTDITEINVDIEVEVYCGGCGAGLSNQSTSGNINRRNKPFIEVVPCEKCLCKARDEGYSEGYDVKKKK